MAAIFEFITTTNSTRATNSLPPLDYDAQEKELKRILTQFGVSAEIPLDRIPKKPQASQSGNNNSSGSSGSSSSQRQQSDRKQKPKSDASNAVYKGSNVCFGYNSKERPCRNEAVSGGCRQKATGRFYAHRCNYYNEKDEKFCLGSHAFCNGKR